MTAPAAVGVIWNIQRIGEEKFQASITKNIGLKEPSISMMSSKPKGFKYFLCEKFEQQRRGAACRWHRQMALNSSNVPSDDADVD